MCGKKAVTVSKINKLFIEQCKELGRFTINDAVRIGEAVGLYKNLKMDDVILFMKKAKASSAIRLHKIHGQRPIRSVKTEKGNEYVHIFNPDVVTMDDINQLIAMEDKRISASAKVKCKLRRTGRWIEGQLTLEEVFRNADNRTQSCSDVI